MLGWLSVTVIAAILVGTTFFFVRRAMGRWWEYIGLLIGAVMLFRPLYDLVSGDVSRVLPSFIWSDGFDGKDQIIWASIASTICLPLLISAALILMFKNICARIL
ncbi:MAG: hypothetical protein ACOY4O_07955 [Pseudomonadota bacterium]